jgi:predicted transcriptional regulator
MTEPVIDETENLPQVKTKRRGKRRSPLDIINLILGTIPTGEENALSLSELSKAINVDVTTISNYIKIIEVINTFPKLSTFKKQNIFTVKKKGTSGRRESRTRNTISVWFED